MFVVGCTSTPGNDIELLIDSDTSVAIDACVRLSRSIEEEFDRDEEDFSLTVASAGIGSELKACASTANWSATRSRCCSPRASRCWRNSTRPMTRASPSPTREKQAVEGKKTQATGDGDAPLRVRRNQVRAGVAGFQIGTRAGQPGQTAGAAGKNKHKLKTR